MIIFVSTDGKKAISVPEEEVFMTITDNKDKNQKTDDIVSTLSEMYNKAGMKEFSNVFNSLLNDHDEIIKSGYTTSIQISSAFESNIPTIYVKQSVEEMTKLLIEKDGMDNDSFVIRINDCKFGVDPADMKNNLMNELSKEYK